MVRKLLGPVVLALAFPVVLAAQSQATTGVIRGTVTDPSGTPVAAATLTLHETQTGFQRPITTSERGIFIASLMPLGTYDVTARGVGFSETRRTGVRVGVGETVDLTLPLAAVQLQAVVVEATQPVVEASKTENSTRLPNAAVSGLPNNGRNYLNLTLLTPQVAIVQGPDGDELTIAGQKGIHNNVAVDGADFNNPFFGEQRGGQRPAFTFNLDAVQEIVVLPGGANPEFGRSSGGFVNVITKSGTNQLRGSLHYFGKNDALSGTPVHAGVTYQPDFRQHQFGFTLGGPLKRDKAFFFLAYDQQIYDEVKQQSRPPSTALDPRRTWMNTADGGALAGDFGSISRTNDARALLAKFDFHLSDRHSLSLKYNYTWSEQQNGTFDVDTWARSANGLERDHSNAVNGSLVSYLSSSTSNEFRFQYSREDRPRPYDGARSSLLGANRADPPAARPFPDVAMDFANHFRFGMPFFLPIDYYDTRVQVLDNISLSKGNHFFKLGGEYNRVNSVQTFIGFANSRYIFGSVHGFLSYLADSTFVECSGGGTGTNRTCPAGQSITGPVQLYLQQAGVGQSVRASGTQQIPQNELAVYIQDTWEPHPRWTLNYGVRWEAQLEPDPITPPSQVFFAPFIGQSVTNATRTYAFPSNGTIPSDKKMWQPRLGIAFDPEGNGRQVFRANAVVSYTHARTDHLTRFINRNDAVFGSPWSSGLPPGGTNGITTLTTVESSAKSRYNGVTIALKRVLDPHFQFQLNYTLSFDKSDDDNERDPFTFRYAKANDLGPEYNWSDRDQRHRFNGWALVRLPGDIFMDHRVSYYSAQPISASCGPWSGNPFAPPAGQRATGPADRICGPAGATVLTRNTLRKDNAYFSWDVRISRPFAVGARSQVEVLVEIFNLTGNDNFRDPSYGNLVFNFDGTIRSGLGDPRQVQAGVRWLF